MSIPTPSNKDFLQKQFWGLTPSHLHLDKINTTADVGQGTRKKRGAFTFTFTLKETNENGDELHHKMRQVITVSSPKYMLWDMLEVTEQEFIATDNPKLAYLLSCPKNSQGKSNKSVTIPDDSHINKLLLKEMKLDICNMWRNPSHYFKINRSGAIDSNPQNKTIGRCQVFRDGSTVV